MKEATELETTVVRATARACEDLVFCVHGLFGQTNLPLHRLRALAKGESPSNDRERSMLLAWKKLRSGQAIETPLGTVRSELVYE